MNLKKIFLILILYLGIDYIYLKLNNKMYNDLVLHIQKEKLKTNYLYATLSYIIMTISFYHFVKNDMDAILIGLSLYGLWNAVNGVIFVNWTLETTLKDTLWGISLNYLIYKILSFVKMI